MNREDVKSVVLVSLVVISIIMTGVLLKAKTPKIVLANESENLNYDDNIENIFYPQGFFISFGGGSYTGVYSEEKRVKFWNEGLFILKNYLSNLDLSVIAYDQWREMEDTRSVHFKLPFDMKFSQICEILGMDGISKKVADKKISDIIIPIFSSYQIYLGNLEQGEYFELRGKNKDETLSEYILELENSDFTEYRRLDSLISFKNIAKENFAEYHNSELMPITKNNDIPVVKVRKELDFSAEPQDVEAKSFLSRAFGNSTDFIKKIKGVDGSIAYVYGYSDKILRLDIDGKIEYRRKLSQLDNLSDIKFVDGIKMSLGYINRYGGFPKSLYLVNYLEDDSQDELIRKYYFNYKIKNLNIFTKNMEFGYAIEVVFQGNKLIALNKNIRRYVKTINVSDVWQDGALYIDDIIDKNFKIISKNYDTDYQIFTENEGKNWSMSTYIIDIIKNVRNIEMIYYIDVKEPTGNLIPSWHFIIGNTSYYFDLYSGNLLYDYKILD